MNFDIVDTTPWGEHYMKFDRPFSIVERIQLLERSILVHSYTYYELNENLISDFQYDENAKQLADLAQDHMDEFKRSRYYPYFHDFVNEDDDTVFTSGFDLIERVREHDVKLFHDIHRDAIQALETRRRGLRERLAEVDQFYAKLEKDLKKEGKT